MKKKRELTFLTDKGIETQTPELTSVQFRLSDLENLVPIYARFRLLRAHLQYVAIPGETVRALPFSFNIATKTLNFYAVTEGTVYRLEISGSDPSFNQIGTFPWTEQQVVTWGSWDDASTGLVYFTKWDTFLSKIESEGVTEITPTWTDKTGSRKLSARYSLIIDNRLVIANIKLDDGRYFTRRLQWSDVGNPEDFEITSGKEGDLFDLESGNLEVTGLFNHRGYLTIFSRTSIWRAQYIGYPRIYRFEPVYTDFGNVYHQAAIGAKELVFFIGEDNFYVLDGFSPRPIGDAIWNYWKTESVNTTDDEVIAFHDSFENEIMWKFIRRGQSDVPEGDYRGAEHFWLLVYNYKEGRWSTRTADGMNVLYNNQYPLRGFQPIDTFHSGWDGEGAYTAPVGIDDEPWDTRTIDGDWQYFDFPQQALVGRAGEVAEYQKGGFTDFNEAPITATFQSQEFFFGSFMDSEELSEVKLVYQKMGNPLVELSVGVRDNQDEEITWYGPYVEKAISTDGEGRFIISTGIRSKLFTFKVDITNSTDNYVTEINGGSILLSGLKVAGTEV